MKTNNMTTVRRCALYVSLVAALFAISLPAAAYEVTSTSVHRLDDRTALFMISYEFGFLNRELAMPIHTKRDSAVTPVRVGYEFFDGSQVIASGAGPAIVLTKDEDVTIAHDHYHLPRGKNATFTLVGILRQPEPNMMRGVQMRVTHLPFTLKNGTSTSAARVPASVRSDYQTKFISINDGLTITGSSPALHLTQ
jgi:hypothetical protein